MKRKTIKIEINIMHSIKSLYDELYNLRGEKIMSECYLYVMGHYATKMIYIGITNDLKKRVEDHKNNLIAGFSSEYKVDLLIYYERFSNVSDAVEKEQLYQKWKNRGWLLTMIAKKNPLWNDLYNEILIFT